MTHIAEYARQRPVIMPLLLQLATLVGCSMGAAVIWAHLELFGDARIGKCVFVDQAPLQVRCKLQM